MFYTSVLSSIFMIRFQKFTMQIYLWYYNKTTGLALAIKYWIRQSNTKENNQILEKTIKHKRKQSNTGEDNTAEVSCHSQLSVEATFWNLLLKFTVRKMTFITDTPTLRVMMNGFDLMVKETIDVQRTEK